ncbi:hypothetical protein K788_0006702 [Paraburkholderia caribensis MBA4]|uniref:Uncharacterized protein n=1 Tax=Paraburkholderia caribensis MBA4 TaxID=1323664 RepID=A0A0P0R5A9_9BURK|nr:hypothetical protein K788_0006702 [Paraburkholderia caribensis MBA4]
MWVWLILFFAGIRDMTYPFMRRPCTGRDLVLVLVARGAWWFAFVLYWHPRCVSLFHASPLCGAALTFFAAAKKVGKESGSHRQPLFLSTGPQRPRTSHGNAPVHVRCQRPLCTPHPLHIPASQHAAPDRPRPPWWQTVCRPSRHARITPDWVARSVFLIRANLCGATTCTQFATWAAHTMRCRWPGYGGMKWVMRWFGALATGKE